MMDDFLKICGLLAVTLVLGIGWWVGETVRALLNATWTPYMTVLAVSGCIVVGVVLAASVKWGLQAVALHLTRLTMPQNVNVGTAGPGGIDPKVMDAWLRMSQHNQAQADRASGAQVAGGTVDPWT